MPAAQPAFDHCAFKATLGRGGKSGQMASGSTHFWRRNPHLTYNQTDRGKVNLAIQDFYATVDLNDTAVIHRPGRRSCRCQRQRNAEQPSIRGACGIQQVSAFT